MSASIAVEVIVDNVKAIDAILTEMIITQHSIIITIILVHYITWNHSLSGTRCNGILKEYHVSVWVIIG